MDEIKPDVIRGNISEIKTLALGSGTTKGVDADAADVVTEDNLESMIEFAKAFSAKSGAVIAITGAIDLVADSKKCYVIRNGSPMMSRITGTGCMLGAVCATFMTTLSPLEAAVSSCIYFGICGEMAETKSGNGSFMVNLMDKISTLGSEEILKHMNMEEK